MTTRLDPKTGHFVLPLLRRFCFNTSYNERILYCFFTNCLMRKAIVWLSYERFFSGVKEFNGPKKKIFYLTEGKKQKTEVRVVFHTSRSYKEKTQCWQECTTTAQHLFLIKKTTSVPVYYLTVVLFLCTYEHHHPFYQSSFISL